MARHPEYQYLDLLEHLLEKGDRRIDRTGVGTLSAFGAMMRFDISDGTFPAFTTKRVYWKTAIKEMLWFLTGQTNIQSLLTENVRIWTDWPLEKYRKATGEQISQEAFEERILADDAFAREWGDLGPVYGKQWRRWLDANGKEHDQIATVIETLKTNPASRRMLFHAWNVGELDQMALAPCHAFFQFYVRDGELSCQLYQRSADLFLGVPFNIASYAVLTLMVAQVTGLKPGEFVHTFGDLHIYSNHLEQAKKQLTREPRDLPVMKLNPAVKNIHDFVYEDFTLENYDPRPHIKASVAK